MTEPKYLLKTIILGDSGVGKSSLMERVISPVRNFDKDMKPTIGLEFATHKVYVTHQSQSLNEIVLDTSVSNTGTVDSVCGYKLQIWDCAGSPKYYEIVKSYFRGSHIVILVFDITNEESFDSLQDWYEEVYNNIANNYAMIIVGNKCDLSHHRQVSTQRAQAFADAINGQYIETSAKEATHVQSIFKDPVHKIDDLYHKSLFELEKIPKKSTVKFTKMDIDEEGKRCGKCF